MKLSGFTFIRNGTQFEYPYLESLRSLLPLVDELVINVGIGSDDTLEKIKQFSSQEGQGKVVFFETDWDTPAVHHQKGGLLLSQQTNLALQKCSNDWCFYLQADEVIHEEDIPQIRTILAQVENQASIEGILFDYVHFYGSFDVIQQTRNVYRREIRLIRKNAEIHSIGDAQSFRKKNGKKLHVVRSGARIFHYGWVRSPEVMREKTFQMDQFYHGVNLAVDAENRIPHTKDNYRYKRILGLKKFTNTHPAVMYERIQSKGWNWNLEDSPRIFSLGDFKKVIFDFFERLTGYRLFEYKNYKLMNVQMPRKRRS